MVTASSFRDHNLYMNFLLFIEKLVRIGDSETIFEPLGFGVFDHPISTKLYSDLWYLETKACEFSTIHRYINRFTMSVRLEPTVGKNVLD